MQDELWRFMEKVVPILKSLSRTPEVPINQARNTKTLIRIALPLPNGTARIFQCRLGNEPLFQLNCVTSGAIKHRRSNCLCTVEGEIDSNGNLTPLPTGRIFDQAREWKRLFDIWSKLYEALGITNLSNRASIHTASIQAI